MPAKVSTRSALLQAFYSWIVNNRCTPYILVDTHLQGVLVPQQYAGDNHQMVLNISESSVADLSIEKDAIRFKARFGGVLTSVQVPVGAVMAIYAYENGQGVVFE